MKWLVHLRGQLVCNDVIMRSVPSRSKIGIRGDENRTRPSLVCSGAEREPFVFTELRQTVKSGSHNDNEILMNVAAEAM